jgi:hypothetical protein
VEEEKGKEAFIKSKEKVGRNIGNNYCCSASLSLAFDGFFFDDDLSFDY